MKLLKTNGVHVTAYAASSIKYMSKNKWCVTVIPTIDIEKKDKTLIFWLIVFIWCIEIDFKTTIKQ